MKARPELDVKGGVDDGVEGAVDVAQPSESTVECRRHVAGPAVGIQDVSHKERQPADEEHAWCGEKDERELRVADVWKGRGNMKQSKTVKVKCGGECL